MLPISSVIDIEHEWDKQYENHWNRINQQIISDIFLQVDSLTQIHMMKATINREELIKFMVSIEWRTKFYHPEIQETFDKAMRDNHYGIDFKKIPIPENERLFSLLKTLYDVYAHSIMLKLYRDFIAEKGPIMDEAQKFINEAGIVFLIAPERIYYK